MATSKSEQLISPHIHGDNRYPDMPEMQFSLSGLSDVY